MKAIPPKLGQDFDHACKYGGLFGVDRQADVNASRGESGFELKFVDAVSMPFPDQLFPVPAAACGFDCFPGASQNWLKSRVGSDFGEFR
ncbi:MAG: hypothetical protein PF795_02950 [Kiritimatiellae bacterium]|jgi:hypothetical protein|nr:hypothetical protein [Kiritimatiellia bacterium]